MTPLSHRSPIALDECTLARTINLIGDRWTLLILRSAMFGLRRFDDFQRELSIPRTVLSGRLKALTDEGLMQKQSYKETGKRPRPEYVLSEKGRTLQPILMSMMQWGNDWLEDGQPAVSFTDRQSRQKVRTGFIDETGRSVAFDKVRLALKR